MRAETRGSPGVPCHRLKSFFREWPLLRLLSCQADFIGLLLLAAVKCVTAAPDSLCQSQQAMGICGPVFLSSLSFKQSVKLSSQLQ